MAGSFSNFMETLVLTWAFKTSTATRPTTLYIAALTAGATESSIGTEVSTSGTAYARIQNDAGSGWTVSGNTATNTSAITWSAATASWGTVVGVAICDASSSGNVIAYGTLTTNKTIDTGDTLTIPSGSLSITLD